MGPPPSQNWHAERIAQYFADREVRIRLGMEGVLFIALFYYLFGLGLSKVIEHVEGPRKLLSQAELFGGVATTLVVIAMAVLWLTASFRAGDRPAESIQRLNDLGFMVFVMTAIVTSLQFIAFGVACLISPAEGAILPRWVGWLSILIELTFLGCEGAVLEQAHEAGRRHEERRVEVVVGHPPGGRSAPG
jgi:hypothetical protein